MKHCLFILICLTHTLDAWSQCTPDRHNTSLDDSWVSCNASANPNGARGTGHWIMYDFSFIHKLKELRIWNYNHPDNLDRGIRDYVVDISTDGMNWTQVLNSSLSQASGLARYEGEIAGDFLEQEARFVLLTAINNYGDACVGLSELRFSVLDETICVDEHMLTGDLMSRRYYADRFISTQGELGLNEILHLQAGDSIELQAEFLAYNGAELILDIQPCR